MTAASACPRCGIGEVLAVLRLPHVWTGARGNRIRVVSDVLLCARCDADDPLAGPVVTYFIVHGSVQPDGASDFARVLLRWVAGARPPEPDENALRAETEAWYRGEL
ncbi:DUF6300 family protein [Actinomadura roseirufa]|uniref:DUF6300 family protein n=1 Tax=Actinomadura roseirufa TaxID=2094049 RepID=UPI001F5F036A|nr:DUF6300 family protein [Actinomadura roseirufa]